MKSNILISLQINKKIIVFELIMHLFIDDKDKLNQKSCWYTIY